MRVCGSIHIVIDIWVATFSVMQSMFTLTDASFIHMQMYFIHKIVFYTPDVCSEYNGKEWFDQSSINTRIVH